MKIKAIIDRIEEPYAVIELDEENFVDFPLKFLPEKIKEGDALFFSIEKGQ